MALFDPDLAAARRDAAVELAEAAAPLRWLDDALDAVRRAAVRLPQFTADDVWALLGAPDDVEPRALGPVMLTARRRGWCAPTDRVVTCRRPSRHGAPLRVWESRIVGAP